MKDIREIIHRLRVGQSIRHINREMGVHRSIISKLVNLATTHLWLNPEKVMPSEGEIALVWNQQEKIQTHPLDMHREQLEQWHKESISSIVMHRLLKDKCTCDVQSIRRYRKKCFPKQTEPVMVRSTVPGRDLDLDFGELGIFLDHNRTPRKVWLFSLRLRHSRKAYREIVFDQKISTFLMGHVHAFEYFNGVPRICIPDNLKAAVIRSTIDNDMINRSYQELAEHYKFVIAPCLPRTPQHKGGVEGDVKYVKNNFLPYFLEKQKEMRVIMPLVSDLRDALNIWDKEIADVRLVYGVGKSPLNLFNSEEKEALLPLPKNRFEPTSWVQCVVRREWRIMAEYAYYSVPYEFIDKQVEVCITSSFVRVFHEGNEIALHERATEKWEYKRKAEHAPPLQEAVLQCNREGLLSLAERTGVYTHQVAEAMLAHPHIDKLRSVRHMLRLADKYSEKRLEDACKHACSCKLYSYRNIKNILENNLDCEASSSLKTNKIISLPKYRFARDPADYKSEMRETFEETIERLHPYSQHGNAMMESFYGVMADRSKEEDEQIVEKENNT